MKGLSYLNSYGETSITVTDNRYAKIIVDRNPPLLPRNEILTITSTSVICEPGLEILEIINGSVANVRYQVTIKTGGSPLLSGSSINWLVSPAGTTVTVVGNTYTLSGITNINIWNDVKNFVWNLPANYATYPNWFLEVSIIYYDEELGQDQRYNWIVYDDLYYYVSQMSAVASSYINPTIAVFGECNMSSTNTLNVSAIKYKRTSAAISSQFSIVAVGQKNITDLKVNASVYCSPIFKFKGNAQISVVSSITPNATEISYFDTTLAETRTFYGNKKNSIFSSLALNGTYSTYTLEISSPGGTFSTNNYDEYTSIIKTGWPSEVNTWLDSLKFYPNVGISANTTCRYKLWTASTLLLDLTLPLIYGGDGHTYVEENLLGSGTYVVPLDVMKYCTFVHLVLVGAGGGGGAGVSRINNIYSNGGGAGAGTVVENTYSSIYSNVLTYSCGNRGTGGTGGSSSNITNWSSINGTNGENSTISGLTSSTITAYGGRAGKGGDYTTYSSGGGDGGNNGDNSYLGGQAVLITGTTPDFVVGGSGAAALGPGTSYTGPTNITSPPILYTDDAYCATVSIYSYDELSGLTSADLTVGYGGNSGDPYNGVNSYGSGGHGGKGNAAYNGQPGTNGLIRLTFYV